MPLTPEPLVLEACRVDLETGVVRRPGAEAEGLSPLELQLLRYLVAHPREPIPRERLLQEVWGYRPGVVSRSVDTTMARLRARIERAPEQPRHLLSLRGVGYRYEPPDARSAPVLPLDRPIEGTNLGAEPTSFVGRREELVQLAGALASPACLVTVLGPGGIGKTRLARQAALAWLQAPKAPSASREAWFVALESTRELAGLVSAVARVLGLTLLHDRQDPLEQVGQALALRGELLVVLDNIEQIVEPTRVALGQWREQAPKVRWLLTSRVRTRLAGERLIDLPPLEPEDAVALYLARARLVRPDLEADAAEVAALAEHLDRLPLALELAASRARVFSPGAVLQRLDRGLSVIDGTGQARTARQASLRATLAWSWALLGPAQREALVQATAFRGGFDLAAAEAVLAPRDLDPIDALEQLADHSLIRCTDVDRAPRFGLLHSVEAFATEAAEPGALAAARARHRAHFAALARDWEAHLRGPHARSSLEGIQRERENLLAVVEGAAEDPAAAAAAALALASVVAGQGPTELLERLLATGIDGARAARDARLEARLLLLRGHHHRRRGLPDAAREDFGLGRRTIPGLGPSGLAALLLAGQASLHLDAGDNRQADALYLEALEEARMAGDAIAEATLVGNRSVLRLGEGRLDEARRLGEEALALHRAAGNRASEGNTLYNLAVIELRGRAGPEAETLLHQALEIHRSMANHLDAARALVNLSAIAVGKGRLVDAERHAREALAVYRATGTVASMALVETNLMDILLQSGQSAEAESRLREALAEVSSRVGSRYRGERSRQRAILTLNLFLAVADQGRLEEALPLGKEAWRRVQERTGRDMAPYVAGVLGVVSWLAGDAEAGLVLLRRSMEEARREGQPRSLVVFGCALLAILGVAADPGLAEEIAAADAGPQAAEARALLTGGAPSSRAQASSCDLRLLARIRRALDEQAGRVLRVSADGAWFEQGGARTAMPARGTGRALLTCLAEAHRRGQSAVPWPVLHAAGWPEAAPHPTAGLARLRVAISRLRALGVAPISWIELEDGPGGYGLEPGLSVEVVG